MFLMVCTSWHKTRSCTYIYRHLLSSRAYIYQHGRKRLRVFTLASESLLCAILHVHVHHTARLHDYELPKQRPKALGRAQHCNMAAPAHRRPLCRRPQLRCAPPSSSAYAFAPSCSLSPRREQPLVPWPRSRRRPRRRRGTKGRAARHRRRRAAGDTPAPRPRSPRLKLP